MCSCFLLWGQSDRKAVYLVGDFDYNTGKFIWQVSGEIDWGMDYYAPQSFLAPDGRRIIVGWANEWEWMPLWKDWGPTYREGWCGFFNIPLEVRLMEDSTLQFLPIEEIKALRQNPEYLDSLVITEEETELRAGDGVAFELKLKVDLERQTRINWSCFCAAEKEKRRYVCLILRMRK